MKLIAFDTKSKARIREHGDDWTPHLDHRGRVVAAGNKALMKAKDGYLKWWPVAYVDAAPGWPYGHLTQEEYEDMLVED